MLKDQESNLARLLSDFTLAIPICEVAARPFDTALQHFDSLVLPRVVQSWNAVTAWLLGAYDGKMWGWWGPVSQQVAQYAVEIFNAIDERQPTTPERWAERARRYTRHAHAGLGNVAVGTFELAVWDLAGQRTDRPVWAFFCETPAVTSVKTYMTCAGINPRGESSRKLAADLADRGWTLQKWQPHDHNGSVVEELRRSVGDKARIAVDIGGRWSKDKVVRFLEELSCNLAWIEEPLPPWRFSEMRVLPRPAPFAAGEHCYGPHETPLLEAAGIEIWQPDAVFCGGFVNFLRMADRAATVGARFVPHGGGLIPAIHAAACGVQTECVEWNLNVEPKRQAHLTDGIAPDDRHRIPVPYHPGWAGRLKASLRK